MRFSLGVRLSARCKDTSQKEYVLSPTVNSKPLTTEGTSVKLGDDIF